MARVTRQSARLVSKLSDTATPMSNASPCFSSGRESLATGAETPITSDIEQDTNNKTPSKTLRVKANSKTKRAAEFASNDEDSDRHNAQAPPAKRRAVANLSYVAVPRRTAAKGKGKEKVFTYPCLQKVFLTIRQASVPPPPKNKGTGKATVINTTPAVSDAEDASDLEYDEDEPMEIDESDDSGSEFKIDSDAEDEEIMVDAAIRSSLQTAPENIAGPSSRKVAGLNAASLRAAVAAERRLARMNAEIEFEFETPWASQSHGFTSSEEEPLATSSKGKGKVVVSTPTKKVTPLSDNSKSIMTMSELRAAQREARSAFLSARRANKKEERALVTKLGRRLTHASSLTQLICNSNL